MKQYVINRHADGCQTALSAESEAMRESIRVLCVRPPEIEQILLMLHGYQSAGKEMQSHLDLEHLAEAMSAVIVMPDMGDDYYISREGKDVDRFLAEELPALIREKFQLEESMPVSIAGLSMGGYGSVLVGVHRPTCFRHVIAISGAFIQNDVLIGNPEIVGDGRPSEVLHYFLRVFGPMDDFSTNTDRNPEAAVLQFDHDVAAHRPDFLLICGSKDLLYTRNQHMCDRLSANGFDVRFKTIEDGDHNWETFQKAMDWMCVNRPF